MRVCLSGAARPSGIARQHFRLILLALLGGLASTLVGATPTAADTDNNEHGASIPATVRLACDNQWRPYYGPQLRDGGVLLAIVRAAMETRGHDITADFVPWSRAINATSQGHYDAIPGMYYTEERAKKFRYSEPILPIRTVLIGKRGEVPESYEALEDLSGYTFSVLNDNAYSQEFDEANLRKVSTPRQAGQINAVTRNKRVIAAAANEAVFLDEAKRMDYAREWFQVIEPPLKINYAHLAVPKTLDYSEDLIDAFNAGLKRIRSTGRLQAILKDHDYTTPIN